MPLQAPSRRRQVTTNSLTRCPQASPNTDYAVAEMTGRNDLHLCGAELPLSGAAWPQISSMRHPFFLVHLGRKPY